MINHSTPDQQITSQFESNVMSIYKFLALKFAISTSSKNANPIPDGKRKLAIQQRTATQIRWNNRKEEEETSIPAHDM